MHSRKRKAAALTVLRGPGRASLRPKGDGSETRPSADSAPVAVSAHYVTNSLAEKPPHQQLLNYESRPLNPKVWEKITKQLGTDSDGLAVEWGIHSSPEEHQLIFTLAQMIRDESSETFSHKKRGFYLGSNAEEVDVQTDRPNVSKRLHAVRVTTTYYNIIL